jgi:DNA-binding response OmpR family regulator/Flp pilus assembly protein TadD
VTKQNLLVVDADPRSLRVLEVSLRNAGYNVAGCPSVGKAFEILHANKPDLILSDTTFADMNGFEFVEQLRQNGDWSEIPFMFLSSDGSIESKIRGLELGVEDYLTKPIYIREVVARVGIELARQARAGLALKSTDARTRFSGSLSEMSVVDLLQTIDVSRKSGVLTLVAVDGQEGMISFDSGAVINATVEDLRGEDAIYRQLLWREGTFDLEFRRVSLSERTVHRTTQALLMEGMRRLDEWSRLLELLPSFDAVLEVEAEMLRERLRELPDDQNDMVRLIDGRRTVGEVLLAHGGDHVDALRKVVDLYFEGMVREVGRIQDSIPVLAEAFVYSPAPPPREGIHTIPGPGGNVADVSVPGAPGIPEVSSTSVTSPEMMAASGASTLVAPASETPGELVSVPPSARVPALASVPGSPDHVTTPVSLPSPKLDATDISDEEITTPAARSAPPPPDTKKGWQPAPPPGGSVRPRQATPKGFQQARPERSAFGGGTILNWSGRLPDIDHLDDASGRETVEVGQWDDTLSELREDPDVDEAIEAIDSDPPPGPFVRSTPPSAPPSDETVKGADSAEGAVVPDYVEPPEVDPPPLTYEQVFESEEGARIRAPRAVGGTSMVVAADPKPNVLPWAVLLLALVLGVSAVAFVVSQRRATDVMPASAPVAVSEPTAAPVSTAAPTPVSATAPAAAKSSPAAEEAATVEPAVENADAIYPETGAIDTYAAQLELARRLKRGSRAVKAYRRAIALNPDGAEALAELGRLMLARQHTREAAELAERATAIDPTNALAWVTLGAARQMRGDRQGARQAYQSCAKLGKGRYVSECRAMLR